MGKEYLRSVAQVFITNHREGLRNFCFVFPNKRSSLFFRKYLSETAEAPVFSPSFTTINELFGAISGLVVLDKITLLYRLYCSFAKVIKDYKESFDDFLYWGDMILNDFDDVDKYLVDAQKLFTNVKDLKEIDSHYSYMSPEQIKAVESFWGILIKYQEGEKEKAFISLWTSLYDIYTDFRESLLREGYAYEGMVYRLVAEKVKEDDSYLSEALSNYSNLVFVGLNALSECEKTLFDRLQRDGIADFYWDYYGDVIKDPFNRSSMFMENNVRRYPSKYQLEDNGGVPDEKPAINLISVPSSVGGAKYVHNILNDILDRGAEDLTNTAIVLPDERLLFPLLNAIPERIKDINVTMGYSLSNSSVTPFIWSVASMQDKIRKKGDSYSFYYKGVMEVLSNSFLKSNFSQECSDLRSKIIDENMIYVPAERLGVNDLFKVLFTPVLPREGEELFDSNSIAKYLIGVVEACSEFADKINKEFLLGFVKCLNLLGSIPLKTRKDTFFRMLRQLSASVSIPFSGEPLRGLQIMGPLETRCLDFENIIVLSMNEGVFPGASVSTSIIPYNLRRGFGLPTYEFQDAISAYYFYRSIARAKNISFIHDSRGDSMRGNEFSRYIMQLEYHHKFRIEKKTVQYPLQLSDVNGVGEVAKDDKILESLKTINYSPSSLLVYKACPMKFYFQYVMKLREDEEVSEDVDSGSFGDIFHYVMESVYKENRGEMTAEFLRKVAGNSDYLNAMVKRAYKEKMNISELEGKNILISYLIADYAKHTLLTDSYRAPFTVKKTEETYKAEWTPEGFAFPLKLKGTVDRIDFKEGFYWISDYKTGKSPSTVNAKSILPDHIFQLKFYLYLLNLLGIVKDPSSAFLSIYYTREIYSHKIFTEKLSISDFINFKSELDGIFTEIFNKNETFKPCEDVKNCEYCNFKLLCNRK